jgi:disulfide bond formation protein DsbB
MATTRNDSPTLRGPLVWLLAAFFFIVVDLLLQTIGANGALHETALRITAWTLGISALMLLMLPGRRTAYLLGFVVCAALMAWALYLQYVKGLEPCPLCMFQRVAVVATGVVFLVAAIHNPGRGGATFYAVLTAITAGTGAALAAWHIWIQAQPKGTVAACGMGLDYMLETMPLTDVIARVLKGSGECAAEGWVFLGLAIPSWTFVFFVAMIVAAIGLVRRD